MKNIHILWVDDEIELLSPYLLFLREKGYTVSSINNGHEAIEMNRDNDYDIILLDENMPGMTGLETLQKLKEHKPHIPVVMVTKSEEENIMDMAIGSKIADYLIKPVNPNQILLVIKKNTEQNRLVSEKTTLSYQQSFNRLGQDISMASGYDDWKEVYRRMVYWELELEQSQDPNIDEILLQQKSEANLGFAKFIKRNYQSWFTAGNNDRPLMSPNIFKQKVYPLLDTHKKAFVILIDNLRLDQWKGIATVLNRFFRLADDDLY
ncbi:MAG: two-component system response regulator, partial [Bacteroidetes bacterium HGW-Bacteroidetes-21]